MLAGRRVLVTGAAGGVGSAAISIARAQGVSVVAWVSRAEQIDYARSLGADDVIELHQGVELGQPTRFHGGVAQPASVMADAPTVSLRLPRR